MSKILNNQIYIISNNKYLITIMSGISLGGFTGLAKPITGHTNKHTNNNNVYVYVLYIRFYFRYFN